MALNNNIADLDQDLAAIYAEAKATWKRDKPLGPWPELNETYRSLEVQKAYYAQGRQTLAEVNKLRLAAGLGKLPAAENEGTITAAKPGQSPHSYKFALDVRMRVLVVAAPGKLVAANVAGVQYMLSGIDWGQTNNNKYYIQFGGYMIAAARRLLAARKIARNVRWGHDWNGNGRADETFTDDPHYEVKGWSALVAAGIKARLA